MRLLGGSLLLGLSAATFSLAPVAEQLLRLAPARLYFIRTLPDRTDYLVFLGLVCVLGVIAGTAFWSSYRCTGLLRRILEAPLAGGVVLGVAHLVYLHLSRYPPLWNAVVAWWERVGVTGTDGWFGLSILFGLLVLGVFGQWSRGWMLAKPMLCGGAAVVWMACGSAILRPAGPLREGPSGGATVRMARGMGPGNPVVWIVLDEWDYDLTYRRSDHKVFPEFERLRTQSVFLDNVRAAGKSTLVAIPGLLMGQSVREYRPATAAGARFVTVGTAESFPGPRTIFDTAGQFGYSSHVVGWYHPYCRIFAGQLSTCTWDDLRLAFLRPDGTTAQRVGAFLRESVELENLPVAGPDNGALKHLARVQELAEQASISATRPGRNFSFLHLPVPHAPFFKLEGEGRMVPVPTDGEGYQSGLDAADRAVGAVRQAMEKAGVWDEALVIVTSDHPYRHQFEGGYGNGHVPMMIKFPHQSSPLNYSHPFQAVETRSLIEDFMQGAVATPERAVAWLERKPPTAGGKTKGPPGTLVTLHGSVIR